MAMMVNCILKVGWLVGLVGDESSGGWLIKEEAVDEKR